MDTHSCNDLLEAAREGHDECVERLIVAGADLNVVNAYGQTPLHIAACMGQDTLCKTLIEAGADVIVVNVYGQTPLHQAAYMGQNPVCKTLVAAGGDPNIANNHGWTPLHSAILNCSNATIRALIAAGGDPDIADIRGRTPLQLAVEKSNKECVKVMIECILTKRALEDDEWGLVPTDFDIGYLLSVVMTRDGRDAAAKLVARLPEVTRKVLETATMCLSRFVSRDVAEQILVRCV